jgi:hypothetical protein
MKRKKWNAQCRTVTKLYKDGPYTILEDGRFMYMDHFIMNAQDDEEVIHLDEDPYNNTKANLILVKIGDLR